MSSTYFLKHNRKLNKFHMDENGKVTAYRPIRGKWHPMTDVVYPIPTSKIILMYKQDKRFTQISERKAQFILMLGLYKQPPEEK